MKDKSLLRRLEQQAIEEGQEWTRNRLKKLIEQVAEGQGDVSPPEPEAPDSEAKQHCDASHSGRDDQS